jgi:hypothetical protein
MAVTASLTRLPPAFTSRKIPGCYYRWMDGRVDIMLLSKNKVVPVLNYLSIMPWRRMRERRYSSTFLHLGTRWRWMISFTLMSLNPRKGSLRYPLDMQQSRSGCCREWNPGRLAHSYKDLSITTSDITRLTLKYFRSRHCKMMKYIVTCNELAWLIIKGSGFDNWIYLHFFTITVNYNSSHIELLLNEVWRNSAKNLGLILDSLNARMSSLL